MPVPNRVRLPLPVVALAALLGCTTDAADGARVEGSPGCRIVQPSTPLPQGLDETSGVAASRSHPGILWTHNDSGDDAVIYAVRGTGELVGRTRLRGADSDDWEDIALGPCPAGTCLYVADIGDNRGKRDEVSVYRLPEPVPGRVEEARAERFRIRYPEGPRDAEALFVLPSGELFVISKGRNVPVVLYRYPPPLRPEETVTLEEVARFTEEEPEPGLQVTGASVSPSGERVAIRTYRTLSLHRAEDLAAGRVAPLQVLDLSGAGEVQGEAVALLDDRRVVLTSEGGFGSAPGTLVVLQCE